jgi:four helix bundle protein
LLQLLQLAVAHLCNPGQIRASRRGRAFAPSQFMPGVWRFQDLVAWRLAGELQKLANAACDKPLVRRDFKFESQLRDAAASGPRNIAEGFGRHFHPEFARFARIARASEIEVMNHLLDALARGCISESEFDQADHAAKKALKAINGLIRYLESTPGYGRR